MEEYKLIKTYPDSPHLGSVYIYDSSIEMYIPKQENADCNNYYHDTEVENFPEFWAKNLHTTEDGVSIYEGDTFWFIRATSEPVSCKAVKNMPSGNKLKGDLDFSTKKAAQEYLDSLKPKLEKGAWYKLFFGQKQYYGLFSKLGTGNVGFWNNDWIETVNFQPEEYTWEKADMKEVKKLLLEEAKRRYPVGTKVKIKGEIRTVNKIHLCWCGQYIIFKSEESFKHRSLSELWNGHTWAEMVEEKKYYLAGKYNFDKIGPLNIYESNKYGNTGWAKFDTEEKRDNYVKSNKPFYSKNDVNRFFFEHLSIIPKNILKEWLEKNQLK